MGFGGRPSGILIVGGAGAFGAKIAALLTRDRTADVVLGGRTEPMLVEAAEALATSSGQAVRHAVIDSRSASAADIARLAVGVVINASGPFQAQSYELARAAIGARCHYIDLADARAFVVGIGALDGDARAADALVVSGASSVPGLSSAVVQHHCDLFAELREIDIAITPGNSFDPGVATVRAVLGGVGKPLRIFAAGTWHTVHGWQGLRRGDFGALGGRWLGYVDVPDLALFPAQVRGLRDVRFQAGLEVSAFQLSLWAASWLVRTGVVASLEPLAPALLALKRRLGFLGSSSGGMSVSLRGLDRDGRQKSLRWLLVARSGHGPFVPALTSVALAKRLLSGAETRRGALPCYALVALDDILAEARGLDIATDTNEDPLPP